MTARAAPGPRSYESALQLLASLQSNLAVTGLFSVRAAGNSPSPTGDLQGKSGPSKTAGNANGAGKDDLNARAIPEMQAWLRRANLGPEVLPEPAGPKMRFIHVAGTKGKGSVCAYLTGLLLELDAESGNGVSRIGPVGTYTSPHVVSVRERIQIDGRPLDRALFAQYFFEVWDALTEAAKKDIEAARDGDKETWKEETWKEETWKEDGEALDWAEGPGSKPFYFRFLTILALHAFLREGVRSAVVECGIGGEYDSTNVLPPDMVTTCVVTPLGIDHVAMLGSTLPQIAWHKMGIARPGKKIFVKPPPPGSSSKTPDDNTTVAAAAAAEREVTVRTIQERAQTRGADLQLVTDCVSGANAHIGVLEGRFQKENQALAVRAAVEHCRVLGALAPDLEARLVGLDLAAPLPDVVRRGLCRARLRGRCETVPDPARKGVAWLLDGAHTAESLREVGMWFAGKVRETEAKNLRKILVFNQQERDAGKLLTMLLDAVREASVVDGAAAGGDVGCNGTVFDKVVFTRNEIAPLPSSPDQSQENNCPSRDLSVQQTLADVYKKLDLGHETADAVAVCSSASAALGEVRKWEAEEGTMVLVTGSFHLVSAIFKVLGTDDGD